METSSINVDVKGGPYAGQRLSLTSFGTLDFLKTVSSHPAMTNPKRYDRDNRFEYLGLVNEPCFRKATGPDPNRYGLWLDSSGFLSFVISGAVCAVASLAIAALLAGTPASPSFDDSSTLRDVIDRARGDHA